MGCAVRWLTVPGVPCACAGVMGAGGVLGEAMARVPGRADTARNTGRRLFVDGTESMYEEILAFWFHEIDPKLWWAQEPAFDALLKARFLPTLEQAAQGELHTWRTGPRGRLAEVLVLDQFSRNIYRGTPRAFAQDPMALALSQEAIASGALGQIDSLERVFLLMPYMHSESRLIHVRAEGLFREWAPQENYEFELRHKAIIDRFGRYPHRNTILGRTSSAEEIDFLEQPGSRF